MTPEDISKLSSQVAAELTQGLAQRALIDEQIKALQAQRKTHNEQIANARSMLRFADTAIGRAIDAQKESPALERAKEAWAQEYGQIPHPPTDQGGATAAQPMGTADPLPSP